ncbi:hypothetical protein C8C77_10399 [Halanaerobium saccharolyticum]|uniref:Uncharacterized protein n=1 Tax=Halanaerobium saccharolyticum TaxID=43595 RepID=A0A4R7Z7X4_9FIRM|nr:hypothetical protein [Halanaerobium saccharolyticum]RAK11118.1 hypothetical protein C7958_10399 [Halanaerobium saccharolyticum]TDW06969.1 hypothetical protein C8C77_10399 [Halanaerobium saccharolyticum]TDX63734.1 hypothetical protein C7956_10299 [Halanaerobium saccharolyticum]
MKFSKLLASPLNKTLEFMEVQQFDYRLKKIKPPFKNNGHLKNKGTKRVLKIEKEKSYYLITWSFQYNS